MKFIIIINFRRLTYPYRTSVSSIFRANVPTHVRPMVAFCHFLVLIVYDYSGKPSGDFVVKYISWLRLCH